MPLWLWFVDSLLLLVALAIVALAAIVVRRRRLERNPGSFEMSVNWRGVGAARGWAVGTAVYRHNTVEWYRTFSLSWRPRLTLPRGDVEISGRRQPEPGESHVLAPDQVVVACQEHRTHGTVHLALTPQALTGLLAWLESSPPGKGVNAVW